ncbi:MAG: efflux RND transporter periplasmic adaptor subunit [Deltaproteobacteria bacterium]|nr:efflux RND transporter periplasmic adaptor subunit [Deltaproteobacteria bacterium]
MEIKKLKNAPHPVRQIIMRIVICVVILMIGVGIMAKLSSLKKPPVEAIIIEKPLRTQGLKATLSNVPVFITGYGEVSALNTVAISPEVSGRVVHVHPRLETGEVIAKGESLYEIDDRNYRAASMEARAVVAQVKTTVQRLEKQHAYDRDRQLTIERNRELAKAEYERVKKLYQTNKVVSQSGVDKAEQAYNSAADAADQLARMVALYPIQIKEAQSSLAAARARLTLTEVNLKRCKVAAPFKGRVKNVALENGQYVTPGQNVLTLADDAVLEIRVPVDSRDARQWLIFKPDRDGARTAWFPELEPAACMISWTEDSENHTWEGHIHRVVQFNQQTRTLTIAVRIDAAAAGRHGRTALPLVEGMFCLVRIPGKTLVAVIRLPRSAVTFDNTVYIANQEHRLKTVPVTVARTEGQTVYISEGLSPGDTVITTRLIDPLENALLEVAFN